MKFKKLIGQIHLWLGLASGLVVFVLGVTGCLMAFEDELKLFFYADKLKVEVPKGAEVLPMNQLLEIAQKAVGEEIPIERIHLENQPDRSFTFWNYTRKKESEGLWYWDAWETAVHVHVNPYTGEVLAVEDRLFEFFFIVLELHVHLLLDSTIGRPIISWSTVIFVILLISGLVLWWPKTKKALKVNTWFRWKSTTKWKRKNYDLHNILGFYSLFFALFIALTGLVWSFSWFNKSVQWVANGGKHVKRKRTVYKSTIPDEETKIAFNEVYEALKAKHPNERTYQIYIPKDSTSAILSRVMGYERSPAFAYYYFDQYSGQLLGDSYWKDYPTGEKVRSYNYDIHTGRIGGTIGKLIAFLVSFVAATLPVTGFYIWWERTKRARKHRQRQTANLKKRDIRPTLPTRVGTK
ncbi:MAG: PepSY-associated TM helix domain-containing protein [Bacteroidota bacterium]